VKWKRLGCVWAPDGSIPWAVSHAHIPTPYLLDRERIRVYFAVLDRQKFGRVTFVDVAAEDPSRVLYVHDRTCLDVGSLGAFDDCGAVPSCAIRVGDEVRLYYIGFQRTFRTPYMLFSGMATSDTRAECFERCSPSPMLDRTADEPYSRGAPFVMTTASGFRMWYWSCTQWTQTDHGVHYNNSIRHATSRDGLRWEVEPEPCLTPTGQEFSLGRPWVVETAAGQYTMLYSARAHDEKYRIGMAVSDDGVHWTREDHDVGLCRSAQGWDSEMVCYPATLQVQGRTYLFYNGNGHGSTGFGCAVLDSAWR
jgi:hypothetical protein